jgi:hypothetical protein
VAFGGESTSQRSVDMGKKFSWEIEVLYSFLTAGHIFKEVKTWKKMLVRGYP